MAPPKSPQKPNAKKPKPFAKKRRKIILKSRHILAAQGFAITPDLYRQWKCNERVNQYPNICVSAKADDVRPSDNDDASKPIGEYKLNDDSGERTLSPGPSRFL